jgi:hypothetical protein
MARGRWAARACGRVGVFIGKLEPFDKADPAKRLPLLGYLPVPIAGVCLSLCLYVQSNLQLGTEEKKKRTMVKGVSVTGIPKERPDFM